MTLITVIVIAVILMMIDYAYHDGNGDTHALSVGDDVDAEKDYMDGSFDKDNDG